MRSGLCGTQGGLAVARLLQPGLERLNLSGNSGFGAASLDATGLDLKALAMEMCTVYTLRHLILADCGLEGAAGGQQVAFLRAKVPNLKSLDLHSNNNLGPTGLRALAQSLRRPRSIDSLNVEDTGLEEEEGGQAVAFLLLKMPKLRWLCVSNNLLTLAGLQALAHELHGIERLEARNVGLMKHLELEDTRPFEHLAQTCPGLKVDSEGHSFEGPAELMAVLQDMELLGMRRPMASLCWADEGSESLDEFIGLINQERELLNLSFKGSQMGFLGLEALRQSKFEDLQWLELEDCGLQSIAGHLLSELLGSCKRLDYLSLAKNSRFENGGLQALADGLESHNLRHLDLSCCSLAAFEALEAFAPLLERLPALQSLLLSSNPGLGRVVAPLLELICRTQISELCLACCNISSIQLSPCRCFLEALDLRGNTEIGPGHLQSLAEQLEMVKLKRLELSDCGLESEAGGEAIALLLAKWWA